MSDLSPIEKTQQILITIMIFTADIDEDFTDIELNRLEDIVMNLPAFKGLDKKKLREYSDYAVQLLKSEHGIETIMKSSCQSLSEKLRETAYALAVEVAVSDNQLSQEELRFLEIIEEILEIPPLAVSAIQHSARVRYRQSV